MAPMAPLDSPDDSASNGLAYAMPMPESGLSLQALFDDADASLKGELNQLMGTKARAPPKPSRSKSRQGKPKKCNCKNSKCLKLYCDCFSAGVMCDGCAAPRRWHGRHMHHMHHPHAPGRPSLGPTRPGCRCRCRCVRRCNCSDCFNKDGYEEKIADARRQVLKRNPRAFNPKFAKGATTEEAGVKHVKGCNCKNSRCLRNYCECFAMGVACTAKCRCENCENGKHGAPPGEDAASEAQLAEYAATHAENHIIFDVEPFAVADGYSGGAGVGAGGEGERGGHAAQAAGADAKGGRHGAVDGLLSLVCHEREFTDDACAMPQVSGNPSLVMAAL